MIRLKAKLTVLLLCLVRKAPFLAGPRLRYLAQQYSSDRSAELERNSWDEIVSEASLMDDKTTWRGVHAVMPLSKEEATKIHDHMYRNSSNFGPAKEELDINFFGSGYQSLGFIDFSNNLICPAMRISLVAELPKSCSANILCLPSGVIYLSLYVYLNSSATQRLSRVSVAHIKRYISLFSLNPFSKKFPVIRHHDRHNQIEDYIFAVARNIVDESNQAIIALLNMWGVKKGDADITRVADFSRDSAYPYFKDEFKESPCHRVVVDPSSKFLSARIGNVFGEEFITYRVPARIGVDGIFIHSEDRGKVEEFDQYINADQPGLTKYAAFLYLKSIENRILSCGRHIGALFGGDSGGSKPLLNRLDAFSAKRNTENLKILISQDLNLNIIEGRLDSLQKSAHWFESAYVDYLRTNLKYMSTLAVDLRNKIKARHDITNAELQLSNLGWMKKYSRRMWYLVWIQLILAVIAVDWSSGGIDKNAMFKNYEAIKQKFTS